MKKILAILMISVMVFVFAGCTNEPVTEPNTTQQPTTEQPTTEQPTTDPKTEVVKSNIPIDTGLKIGKMPVYSREFDKNKVVDWNAFYDLEPVINQNNSAAYYDNWKAYEDHTYYGRSNTYYNNGAVLKINVTGIKSYILFNGDRLYFKMVTNFIEATVEEVYRLYNGCELKKGDKINLRDGTYYFLSGHDANIKFFESYGATIRKEMPYPEKETYFEYYAEGLEYGYYELKPEHDTTFSLLMDFEPSLNILENGEYLVSLVYYEDLGMYTPELVCPWSSCDYTKFDMYKNVTLGKYGSKLLPDFYNTFVKK